MAKVTLENGMVFEGTNDELVELFTKLGAKIPAVEEAEEEASAYRKVTGREARVGDYVKFEKVKDWEDLTVGNYYEIKHVDSDGDYEILDDIDDLTVAVTSDNNFEVYEKVGAEPALEPLKVGVYAKVISVSSAMAGFSVGDIVQISGNSTGRHKTEISIGCLSGYGDEGTHFIRATDEEVAEAKRQQAEKEVAAKAELERKELERKWASINRKPNEFKKGDIVRVESNDDYNGVGGVIEDYLPELRYSVGIRSFNGSYYAPKPQTVTLVAPVESRVDR